ncbi:MAG: prepilin-type N-terminal cleavage/methylation domain-containing protein [Gammaproteobacteria bacterium]|nr:prepilin-type N-terminal cleavage/methylation domain-containing protein [Gammaproteobacteria bacterium]MDE1983636.1 prepilin-type N-terminal cleavage/methylation domain-containing protein [Gammaproteobacteria bacterium]MDE2108814.1 prepilin-type N-terminal cleavage/methylation domain-containing protein [Gammaproteobacteria bacterium]
MCKNQSRGFSLIELMVVVAIIAIIAAIAYPSYERSVLKSHRSDAENLLTQDAQILERCYTQYFSYKNGTCSPPLATYTQYRYYTAVTTVLAASTYVLTATAVGNQTKDTQCASFTIDNTGKKTALTASATTNSTACWSQ